MRRGTRITTLIKWSALKRESQWNECGFTWSSRQPRCLWARGSSRVSTKCHCVLSKMRQTHFEPLNQTHFLSGEHTLKLTISCSDCRSMSAVLASSCLLRSLRGNSAEIVKHCVEKNNNMFLIQALKQHMHHVYIHRGSILKWLYAYSITWLKIHWGRTRQRQMKTQKHPSTGFLTCNVLPSQRGHPCASSLD